MGLYFYSGKKANGKSTTGFFPADSERDCLKNLQADGMKNLSTKYLVSMGGLENILFAPVGLKKLPSKTLITFFEQMQFFTDAGIQIPQALDILSQAYDLYLVKAANAIKPYVSEGLNLADSMAKTGLFPKDIIFQVEAGCESGKMSETFMNISNSLTQVAEVKKKLTSAAIYPAFMILMLVAVTVALLVFIVPSMVQTILNICDKLPAMTEFVIDCSNGLVKNWVVILLVLIAIPSSIIGVRKHINGARYVFDKLLYKIPVIGELIHKTDLANFSNNFSMLLGSGIHIVKALKIVKDTTQNLYFQTCIDKMLQEVVKNGVEIHTAMSKYEVFPPDVLQVVMVGCQSNKLADVMKRIYIKYNADVDNKIKRISSLLEPIAVVLTAAIGGFIIISLYLPMFSVVESL